MQKKGRAGHGVRKEGGRGRETDLLEDSRSVVKVEGGKEMAVAVFWVDRCPGFSHGVPRGGKLPCRTWAKAGSGELGTYLQGTHLRLGSSAVSWTEADQVRLGSVRRS